MSGSSKEVQCLIGSYCRPTSVVSWSWLTETVLKIRLFGLATPWSGDIPLEAVTGKRKSFMVKLPLRDKLGSTTIWCTILTEELAGQVKSKLKPHTRTWNLYVFQIRKLVIFSPMYMITSLVPGDITAVVDNMEPGPRELEIRGLGNTQQLDISGAPENKFGLSFKFAPGLPPSSPPLNVSWGIVDQVRDKSTPVISIDEAIRTSFNYNIKHKKPSGIMEVISRLKMSEQPPTDCKITFTQFHPATNTLTVRLQPHVLVINMTDIPLLTRITETGSSWLIEPASVFQPQPLTSKFYLGLMSDKGAEEWGGPLLLSDSDWTYLSIRPAVQGIVHLHGTIPYRMVSSDNTVTWVSLGSDVSDGIRVLTIKPSFLVHNQTDSVLYIKSCVTEEKKRKPELSGSYAEVKAYQTLESEITPISFWSLLSAQLSDGPPQHSISLSADTRLWSDQHDVPLDSDTRRSVSIPDPVSQTVTNIPLILMTQRSDTQTFIIIKRDTRPHVELHNNLSAGVVYREEGTRTFDTIIEGRSVFVTMPWLTRGFPYVDQVKDSKRMQFSLENNAWSVGVDLTASQETFINLPGLGDIRVTVELLQPTTHIFLEPVSHLEVAARDIRARFTASPPLSPVSTVYETPDTSLQVTQDIGEDQFQDCLQPPETESSFTSSSRRQSIASSFSVIANPLRRHPGHFVNVRCKELSLAVTDDLCCEEDFQEILRMTFSNVDIRCRPRTDYSTVYKTLGGEHAAELDVEINVGDLQVDNQMFKRGLYHFPVLLSGQENKKEQKVNPLMRINLVYTITDGVFYSRDFNLKCSPMALNVEDTLFYKLKEYVSLFTSSYDGSENVALPSNATFEIPQDVVMSTESSSQLIFFNKITVEEISLQVSAHASLKLFVGLEDSKINLSRFENQAVWSTWYSFGHRLSMHYLSGALFKAGWVVGSLDMIGSPAGFTRNVTDGVKDFVSLPYNGIWNGPWGFVVGLSQGSSSLVKHVSAGTLTSITNFASSMSRNLDRLSFDREHVMRNEEVRRLKPQGLGEGLVNGLSGVGISLLGAIGGLAHHPIQVLLEEGVAPVKLIGGVGRGVVGVVTKPLGSAAELIAQTGHGMLSGSGWTRARRPRLSSTPGLVIDLASSSLKHQWKVVSEAVTGPVVSVVEASLFEDELYIPVTLILSEAGLHVVSEDEDAVREVHSLEELQVLDTPGDPTLLILRLHRPQGVEKYEHVSDRVARFVLDSISFAEKGLAPELQTGAGANDTKKMILYLSSVKKQEFCSLFQQVKEEKDKNYFSTIF